LLLTVPLFVPPLKGLDRPSEILQSQVRVPLGHPSVLVTKKLLDKLSLPAEAKESDLTSSTNEVNLFL
jgi:hypothetical protein